MLSCNARKTWILGLCFLFTITIVGCSSKEGKIKSLIARFIQEVTVNDSSIGNKAVDELVKIGVDAVPQLCQNLDSFGGVVHSMQDINNLTLSIQALKRIGAEHPETAELAIPTLLRLFVRMKPTTLSKDPATAERADLADLKGHIRGNLIINACSGYRASGISCILDFLRDEGGNPSVIGQAGSAINMVLTLLQPASLDSLKARIAIADDDYRKALVKRLLVLIAMDVNAKSTLQNLLEKETVPEIRVMIEGKLATIQ